jgi:hypothetical protein
MERINLDNYEAFLLDHFEGNLSKELTVQLKAFVLAHPELEIDLEDDELPVFDKEDLEIDFKDQLLKSSNDIPNSDLLEYLEGNLNKEQKAKFELKLNQDAELKSELDAYSKTLLKPEYTETFNFKNNFIKTEDEWVLNNSVVSYFENTLSPAERSAFEQELKTNGSLRKELDLIQKTRLVADPAVVYPAKEILLKETRIFVLFSYRTAMAAAVLVVLGLSLLFMLNNKEGKALNESAIAVKPVLKNSHKQSPVINNKPFNEVESNTVLVADNKNSKKNKKQVNENKNLASSNSSTVTTIQQPTITPELNEEGTPALATNTLNSTSEPVKEAPVTRYTNVDALAVAMDTDEPVHTEKQRKGFWSRAVGIARQMNGLGVKAVKGEEKENEAYSLSFNSFSVERK